MNLYLIKAGSIDAFICTPFSVGHDDNPIKCFVSFHGKHRMSKKKALKQTCFDKAWLDREEFKPWLLRDDGDNTKFNCKLSLRVT